MARGTSIVKRRKAIEQACRALDGIDKELWAAQGAELGPLLGLVDQLGERVAAGRVAVLAETVERGETTRAGVHQWLLDWAPSFRAGGSARVVTVVDHLGEARYAGLRASVLGARMPVGNAATVIGEYEQIGHRLHPEAQEPVMGALVEAAEAGRTRDIKGIRQGLIARYGYDGEFQKEQDALRERTFLTQPQDNGAGLHEYTMLVDDEAKAVIEAAVQALSAPRPADGERDLRPSGQRRFEALLEVVRRGVASADGVATTPKAQLFVTMDLDDLMTRAGAGTVLGSGDAGSLLGPETVRRIACDAGIVPAVLGKDGEVLDLGRRFRLFTSAQLRALWLRDGHCSFPDCSVPPSWCDGHHLVHWLDGGPTDLTNGALLCGRHHTVVHSKGYRGELRDGQVVWDLTLGSYDHWLALRRRACGDSAAGSASGETTVRGGAEPSSALPVPEPMPTVRSYDAWGQVETAAGDPEPPPWRP